MGMTLWSLLHEVNNLGGSCSYPSTYIWFTNTDIHKLGSIA